MKFSLNKKDLSTVICWQCTADSSDLTFSGIDFDSRRIAPDQLFIAIKGEKLHGEIFLPEVFARGAKLALVETPELLTESPFADQLVVVKDSLKAFSDLASYWREKNGFKVVGITGSLGKTTCKEITRHILSLKGNGTFSQKSFNNHTGVPYTLCNADSDSNWVVLEMGMNHPGELSDLSNLARPDVAAIVSVAPVHIEFFKDLDAIADAKCEILNGLMPQGTIVLNGDNGELLGGFERWKKANSISGRHILRFGTGSDLELKISNARSLGFEGISMDLSFNQQGAHESVTLKLSLIGVHNAFNVAAAVLCAKALFPDLTLAQMKLPLEKMEAPAMRLNLIKLSRERVIVNDCYNSNPTALAAALQLLKAPISEGKQVAAILGDMKELGERSAAYHQAAGEDLSKLGLKYLVVVGTEAKILGEIAKSEGTEVHFAETPEEAAETAIKRGFDVLLIKGSRGVALERATKVLTDKFGS